MNDTIILGMVDPYVKDNKLTYHEFEQIFSMLSLQEQYAVLGVLEKKQIELIDSHEPSVQENAEEGESDEFDILYDDELFQDEDNSDKKNGVDSRPEHLRVRKEVHLSNKTLISMIQMGDAQAKQDLCIKNQGLVDKVAASYEHYLGNKSEFDDLVQAGMIGMVKAAEKFDLNMGTEFSTYAMYWIKQAITREIQDNGFTIRIPVHRMEQISKVVRLDSRFSYESNYYKRLELIADAAGMPIVLVEDCLILYHQFVRTKSLDVPIGEEQDTPLGELIPLEEELSVEESAIQELLRNGLEEALSTLTDREQKVLNLRFGLKDGRARTLEEVGMEFHVTRERIRQIEAKALRKLRHPSRSRKLKDFLE